MALPSSPPLRPSTACDPPSSSPQLPSASASTWSTVHPPRKRLLSEYDSLSSDPLFSDASSGTEDVGQYSRPKRKRMVKGPWWSLGRQSGGSRSRSVQVAKEESCRNVDSGIWMGSDESEEVLDVGQSLSTTTAALDPPESTAGIIVSRCVEEGVDAVDLSGLGLTHLPVSTIRPLHQLILQSHVDLTHPPSEDEYMSLTPSIKLFLASNKLSTLPGALFSLENITVLSLRNNELTELPPSIARLHKLKELNIAGNAITYLPWELLHFFATCRESHGTINVRPNPLVVPRSAESRIEDLGRSGGCSTGILCVQQADLDEAPWNCEFELDYRLKLGRELKNAYNRDHPGSGDNSSEELICLGFSAVTHYNVDGTSTCTSAEITSGTKTDPPRGISNSATPSLFELATRTAQNHFALDEIPTSLPLPLQTALQKASSGIEYGNQKCSNCGRAFVLPRGEWTEFWFIGNSAQTQVTPETVLPFLRRACSWACSKPSEIGTSR